MNRVATPTPGRTSEPFALMGWAISDQLELELLFHEDYKSLAKPSREYACKSAFTAPVGGWSTPKSSTAVIRAHLPNTSNLDHHLLPIPPPINVITNSGTI